MNNNNNNGVPRRIEASPPPFPPTLSCIVAMGIASLIFMGFILTLFTLIGLFMFFGFFCWFKIEGSFRVDDFEIEDMEDFDVIIGDRRGQDGNPLDDERVVEILEGFFRVVKSKKNESKEVLGSIECFGSQAIAESGYSECVICLEDFQKGEKCLVFPVCSHLFHCKCIVRWLEKKLTCPVCRYCVASKANRARGNRTSSLVDLV